MTENPEEFIRALDIHPALINMKNDRLNEMFFKWFKRQNAFQINEMITKIVSALIQIGRIDLAYQIQFDHLTNHCRYIEH